jgi:hypothetical protein
MAIDHLSDNELDPSEQMTFDNDTRDLKKAGEQHGMNGLDGRVKFGLDPAGMMAVRVTAPLVEKVAQSQGTTSEEVWDLIAKLHKEGPWASAGQLSEASDPHIRTYLVLAAACRESGYPGYKPKDYLADRKRVVEELGSFTASDFDARKDELTQKVTIEKVAAEGKVPVAEGDVALPLAVQGYRGCVSKAGEMRFAQTTHIDDSLLEQAGLVKGFVEVYNAEKGGFDRIPYSADAKGRTVWVKAEEVNKDVANMEPAAKRIAPGYVLTYTNEDLAVELVSKAIEK